MIDPAADLLCLVGDRDVDVHFVWSGMGPMLDLDVEMVCLVGPCLNLRQICLVEDLGQLLINPRLHQGSYTFATFISCWPFLGYFQLFGDIYHDFLVTLAVGEIILVHTDDVISIQFGVVFVFQNSNSISLSAKLWTLISLSLSADSTFFLLMKRILGAPTSLCRSGLNTGQIGCRYDFSMLFLQL